MSKSFGFGLLKKAFGCFALSALLFAGCSSGDESSSSSEANTNDGSAVTAVSVSASPSTMDSATGTSTITATITGDDSAAVSWSITSGGDYATLGSSSTNASGGKASVTLTGKNTTASEQSVTVKATAGSKSGTVTVKVPASATSAGGTDTSSGVTSVTLNKTSLNLLSGNTATLTPTVATTSSDIAKTVTWTSSDENVATVSDGTVTAVASGTATITATSTVDATKKATCAVTVESASASEIIWRADDYEAQTCTDNQTLGIMSVIVGSGSVTIDANSKSIDGYSFTKRLKFGGSGSTSKNSIKFTTTDSANITGYYMSGSSENSRTLILANSTGNEVASGTNDGNAIDSFSTTSAVAAGTYYIYSAGSGINVYAVKIAYESAQNIVYPSAVSLSESSLSLDVSDDSTTKTATLTATIENASEVTSGKDTINWSSSDNSVATVSNGVVTAKKAGTATITASCTYGGVSATCAVTVTGTSSVDLVVTPGAKVTTYGWADLANNGDGMSYPNTTNIIVIDDTTYTTATSKCTAFTNAIASGSVTSSSVNSTKAIIVLKGEVDLSVNTITSGYTVKTWFAEFDDTTHKRKHNDIVYDIGSNKAIIGVNGAKLSHGGLRIYASSSQSGENIIIQNVEFSDAHGSTEYDTSVSNYSSKKASADALVIEASGASSGVYSYVPQNIWIDHCKFSDGDCRDMIRNYNHDGAFDMKAGKNVTVSYCEFTNHDKVTLLAPDDTYTSTEQRQITFHHIYYHDTVQRTPRSRGCQLHIYNCYYDTIGFNGTDDNGSGSNGGFMFGPGINSQYIVENCYLGSMVNSSAKKMKYFDTSSGGSSASTFSKFYQSGNSYTFTGSSDIATDGDTASSVADHLTTTKPWTPEYSYESTMSTYSEVQTLVPNAAGVDKSGYTATVSVNGTTY